MSAQQQPQQPPQQPGPPPGRRWSFGAIASLVGIGALGVFMVQNRQDVRIHFLAWHLTIPLWLLTFAAAVFGALVWVGLGVLRRHRRRKARRQARRG